MIMKTTARILVVFLIGYLLFSSFQQEKNISIKGVITDLNSGNTIANVQVILLKNQKKVAETKSDNKGEYYFENLSAGIFSIKITGADITEQITENVIVKTNEITTLNFNVEYTFEILEDPYVEEKYEKEGKISLQDSKRKPASRYYSQPLVEMSANESMMQIDDIPYNTEEYDVINENKFKEVTSNPLSTFSVDVDRASYSNVRRMLNYGQKPPIDAVRIEEMINYFEYAYPQPTDNHPFSINMEYGECPWNTEHQLVHIGIKGVETQTQNIPASNLVFLIDVSGSMESEDKLGLLKESFAVLVENLREKDRVAIVVYAGAAGEVLPSTSGSDKKSILASLDKLTAGGSTAGGAGIELAYAISQKNFIKSGNNRVILATDGDFNVGSSGDADMVRLIEEKRKSGVYLTILGFGMGNYKDSKMEQMSNAGNGNYAYIDNIKEANKVFGVELWGTLFTIAKDVKIQLEFNPDKVKAYRLIGYENRLLNNEDFNDDKKDAGEIGSGHTVTALYEIIPGHSSETTSSIDNLEYQKQTTVKSENILTLKVRYKKPTEDVSNLIVSRVKESDINKVSNNFFFSSAIAEFGMLLRNSEFKANASYSQVKSLVKQTMGSDKYGYKSEFLTLVDKAEALK
ncbi:MAG: von Willebrand factor type A domain-containing protein [Bacteroidales bacterium]|nr:von Willebrand factor type A domain-containing protein [Bacteroidales bacterium]